MMELKPVYDSSKKLSAAERLTLLKTVSALPLSQFNELLFALNPPQEILPGPNAPQSSRATALLHWIENPNNGPGFQVLDELLSQIIATTLQTSERPVAFSISGKISEATMPEVEAFVKLLRIKTGDDSIDVAFIRDGSIKIILNGSLEGLQTLRELFESGEFTNIGGKSIEAVDYVEINTTDGRKARLVQALRLTRNKHILTSTNQLILDLNLIFDLALDSESNSASILILDSESVSALNRIRNIVSQLERALDFESVLISDLDLSSTLDHAQTFARALANELTSILDRNSASIFDLFSARDLASDLASTLYHASKNGFNYYHFRRIDVERADLTNTNLRNIYLRQANLTEVNFSGADLTGTDLTGANLTGANLTGANVTGTIFGGNRGLTDTDKYNLQRRGAILLDPPSSDVPSLVLR